MEITLSTSHFYARGTSILEVLVALALLTMAISGTLHMYAMAMDATKQSFHVTTDALESGSRNERQLQNAEPGLKNNSAGRGKVP